MAEATLSKTFFIAAPAVISTKAITGRQPPGDLPLWNPRNAPASMHFIALEDGTLHAASAVGAFTLRRLPLNRPPLVTWRLRKRQQTDEARLLARYRDLVEVLEHLTRQQAALLQEQQDLLEQQRDLLRRL